MSLYVAGRGEKSYLKPLWKAKSFDFELACQEHGRNDAFWVLCYRLHLAGDELPSGIDLKRLVRSANRATNGLDHDGRQSPYTNYEARQTITQVQGYEHSRGLLARTGSCRRWARKTKARDAYPKSKRLMEALCAVAELSGSYDFACSHRRLGEMTGIAPCSIAAMLRPLERHGLVRRTGFNDPLPGRSKGTSKFSLMPARPEQRIDEDKPPRYDHKLAKWVWDEPRDRGTLTRWAFLRGLARNVPTVRSLSEQRAIASPNEAKEINQHHLDPVSRGSPSLIKGSIY